MKLTDRRRPAAAMVASACQKSRDDINGKYSREITDPVGTKVKGRAHNAEPRQVTGGLKGIRGRMGFPYGSGTPVYTEHHISKVRRVVIEQPERNNRSRTRLVHSFIKRTVNAFMPVSFAQGTPLRLVNDP